MFSENIEIIKQSFLEYKGSGMYFGLYFIAILYIFLKETDKNIKTFLGYFSIVTIFIILNPIFNKCIDTFINVNVYWRMFWLLPVGITIAYAAVKLIQDRKENKEKVIVFFSICLIIMASGKLVYNKENFVKLNNWYKIPDEANIIANAIISENINYRRVMLPETLVPYIRQVEPYIELQYGRQPISYNDNKLLQELKDGNVKVVTEYCKANYYNFIIFDRKTVLSISPEYFEYNMFLQTENYDVYKLVEK